MSSTNDQVTEKELQRALGECALNNSWIFSVLGAAIAIPLGIRRKSLAPLVFLGTTGAMIDILQGISSCERERESLRKHVEDKKAGIPGVEKPIPADGDMATVLSTDDNSDRSGQ